MENTGFSFRRSICKYCLRQALPDWGFQVQARYSKYSVSRSAGFNEAIMAHSSLLINPQMGGANLLINRCLDHFK